MARKTLQAGARFLANNRTRSPGSTQPKPKRRASVPVPSLPAISVAALPGYQEYRNTDGRVTAVRRVSSFSPPNSGGERTENFRSTNNR